MTNHNHYQGPERRAFPLSESQIEYIAEKAAEKAVAKMRSEAYQDVGRWTLNKLYWISGIVAVWVWYWLIKNGFLKP